MRRFLPASVLLLLFALPAGAQVTVDMNALDQLNKPAPNAPGPGPAAPKPTAHKPKPSKPPATKAPPAATAPAAAPAARALPPAASSGAAGFHAPLPPLPGAPPPNAVLAPLLPPVPPTNTPATPPPAVRADAAGAGSAIQSGLRITFASNQGELSPASEASLKALVARTLKNERVSYNVLTYAPGTADDPSTARRLSLARGLAVRSVLMSAGVPSARIYVRALGATPDNGPAAANAPPDRADVMVLGANAPPPELALPPELETVPSEASAPDKPQPSSPLPPPATTQDPAHRPGAGKTP